MTKYNQRQLKEAKSARYFQNTAELSTRALLKCIDSGAMINFPITQEAVRTAQDVWRVSRPYLQGNTAKIKSLTYP